MAITRRLLSKMTGYGGIFYNILHAFTHNPFIELNDDMLNEENIECLNSVIEYNNNEYFSKYFVLNHEKDMSLSHYVCQKSDCPMYIEYIVLKQGISDFINLKCKDQFDKKAPGEDKTPLQILKARKRKVIPQSFIDKLVKIAQNEMDISIDVSENQNNENANENKSQ